MMIDSCLLDTNILLRIARPSVPEYQIISTAVAKLAETGTSLHYTQQNIAELWNVMTRRPEHNGFGFTPPEAEAEVSAIERLMTRLPESEAGYREWRRLIVKYGVTGVQVHDARLAATMRVHGVGHILTLNIGDFARYEGIVVLHPSSV
jgi:predicted nucleic acid-binding protein